MSLHTDPTDIQMIVRHYYEPFYANKFDNLDLTPILHKLFQKMEEEKEVELSKSFNEVSITLMPEPDKI